jgi:hypothetical protein
MRRRLCVGRRSYAVLLAGLLAAGVFTADAQQVDAPHGEGRMAEVRAHSGRDAGVDPNLRLERMLLLLQPSEAQQKAADALMNAQQTPGNTNFHRWVTAAQYADRFGLSAGDLATVTAWLRAQGFVITALPASRGWVEFSGTVAQVGRAFGTLVIAAETHSDAGETRYQASGEVKMPGAVGSLVKGLVSLDGSVAELAATEPVTMTGTVEALAAGKSLSAAPALTPGLAVQWLHLASSTAPGETAESIAIPARSNVRVEDFAAFRKSFGLPESTLQVRLASGADPGRNGEEASTIEAVSWAGVADPEAQIVLVPVGSTNATDGLDLALAETIDGALAHTVSVGYSACESGMSAAHRAFYAALYREAAAQGIAVIAASGDSGAAACHSPEDTNPVAGGFGVNGLASTPWNTAVGAVAFTSDASALTGWQTANEADAAYATGGGASLVYVTPAWQVAVGLPASDPGTQDLGTAAGHHRYLPDVSLPTAVDGVGSRGLAFCFSGNSAVNGCRLVSGGGSSVSAAMFSGIAALLAQRYGPQGNLAPNLYALRQAEQAAATKSAPAFVDVTDGGAMLWCAVGSAGCAGSAESLGRIGFSAGVGYDLASGLGSVNADALVRDWAAQATGTATPTIEMTTIGGVTYNPTADIPLSAKVLSGSGGVVPTGTVQFFDETNGQDTGSPVTLAADGTATYTEEAQFSIGGHNIAAIYSGDSVYAGAESQPITINIQPSATSLILSPSTTTPPAGGSIIVTGTVTAQNPGASPPTGSLTVNLDGLPQGTQRFTTTGTATTASMTVTAPSAGSHTIQGTYSGDINYNNSTSPSVTITVAQSATVTTISATPSTLTAGMPESFTATVAPLTVAVGATYTITGTVSFYDGGTVLLGAAAISNNTAILTGVSLSLSATHTITAVYSGDTSYSTSVSSPLLLVGTLLPVTVNLTESNTVLAPDQPVTLTATVTPVTTPPLTAEQHPSGFVLFYAGTALISGQVPVLVGLGNSGVASTVVPRIPAGQYVISAQYSGDTTFGPTVSNSLNLLAEDFGINCSATNVKMAQGTTKTITCNVSSLGGLAGPIQVACAEQNPPQIGAIGCTFSPNVVQGTGQVPLTIVTEGGNIGQNRKDDPVSRPPGSAPWSVAGGVALAFVGLLLAPIGRRARWLRPGGGKLLVLALLLAGLASAGIGCNNTSGLTGNSGTPLGVHTLQITAGADVGTVTVTHTAYLTVNVTP